jgi:hypothetical protein
MLTALSGVPILPLVSRRVNRGHDTANKAAEIPVRRSLPAPRPSSLCRQAIMIVNLTLAKICRPREMVRWLLTLSKTEIAPNGETESGKNFRQEKVCLDENLGVTFLTIPLPGGL